MQDFLLANFAIFFFFLIFLNFPAKSWIFDNSNQKGGLIIRIYCQPVSCKNDFFRIFRFFLSSADFWRSKSLKRLIEQSKGTR